MATQFDRFSPAARRVMALAQDEARESIGAAAVPRWRRVLRRSSERRVAQCANSKAQQRLNRGKVR